MILFSWAFLGPYHTDSKKKSKLKFLISIVGVLKFIDFLCVCFWAAEWGKISYPVPD